MGQQEEYAVEAIVGKRTTRGGKTEYFIKWEGYPSEQNTWEPKEHLNCANLMKKYEESLTRKSVNSETSNDSPANGRGLKRSFDSSTNGVSKVTRKSADKHEKQDDVDSDDSPSKKTKITQKSSKTKNVKEIVLTDCEKTNKKRKSDTVKKEKTGFARNLKPVEILAAMENKGELMFLMKWEKCEESDLVPAKVAHKKCPQLVIQFYEKRITWKTIKK